MQRDYFPRILEFHAEVMMPTDGLAAMLPGASVEPVPIPNGCTDGFWLAIYDRPEMHLDPNVRRASSSWHHMDQDEIDRGLAKLRPTWRAAVGTSATATCASDRSWTSACAW